MRRTEDVFSSICIWLPPPLGEIICIHENDDDFIASIALKLLFPNVSAVEKWEYRPIIRRPGTLVEARCMEIREATENMV